MKSGVGTLARTLQPISSMNANRSNPSESVYRDVETYRREVAGYSPKTSPLVREPVARRSEFVGVYLNGEKVSQ